jgi:RNA polymerase subunit RPABC4/transcription elongation factor Spt4
VSEKQETKSCKHCKAEIPKNTKVCPNCNKKQGGALKWVIIAVVVIGIGSAMSQGEDESPGANAYIESIGGESADFEKEPSPAPIADPAPEPTETPSPTSIVDPTPEPPETLSPEPIEASATESVSEISVPDDNNFIYVLNTSTQKIHYPNCKSVGKIKPENYATTDKSLNELLEEGYTKCGNCW